VDFFLEEVPYIIKIWSMNIIIENPFTYLIRGRTIKMAWLEGVFIVITAEKV